MGSVLCNLIGEGNCDMGRVLWNMKGEGIGYICKGVMDVMFEGNSDMEVCYEM
jgi:hypothetical protein